MTRLSVVAAATLAALCHCSVVDVSVRSKWPSTDASFVLEASEFIAEEDVTGTSFWQYVDAVVDHVSANRQSGVPNASQAVSLAQPFVAPLTFEVLRLALGARAYSPTIEYQRQLAVSSHGYSSCAANRALHLLALADADGSSSSSSSSSSAGAGQEDAAIGHEAALAGWADVIFDSPSASPSGPGEGAGAGGTGEGSLTLRAVCSPKDLEAALAHAAPSSFSSSSSASVSTHPGDIRVSTYAEGEHWYPAASAEAELEAERSPTVILYLAMDAPGAQEWHRAVQSLAGKGKARAVLRHWLRASDPVLPSFDDSDQDPALPYQSSFASSASSTAAAHTAAHAAHMAVLEPGTGLPRAGGLTWLSGYGVGLDVKSTEYKVIDDRTALAAANGSSAAAGGEKGKAEIEEGGSSAESGDSPTRSPPIPPSILRTAHLDTTLAHILGLAQGAGDTPAAAAAATVGVSFIGGVQWEKVTSSASGTKADLAGAKELGKLKKAHAKAAGSAAHRRAAAAVHGPGVTSLNSSAGSVFLDPTLPSPSLLSLWDGKLHPHECADLGLQAAAVVLDAAARAGKGETGPVADPLQALVTVSSNFPSLARSLSRVPVPPSLRAETEANARVIAPGKSLMTINGIQIDPTSPTFNLFSLFNVLRAESRVVAQLDTLPLSEADRKRVQALAVKGAGGGAEDGAGPEGAGAGSKGSGPVRIDVLVEPSDVYSHATAVVPPSSDGSGRADKDKDKDKDKATSHPYAAKGHNHSIISWLNDVESDPEFRQWPSDLRGLMQPTWQLHNIRRNLYTTVAVVDLGTPAGLRTAGTIAQFSAMRVPIRFGLVVLPESPAASGSEGGGSGSGVLNESRRLTGQQAAQLVADVTLRHGPAAAKAFLRQLATAALGKQQAADAKAQEAAVERASAEGQPPVSAEDLQSITAPEDSMLLTVSEAVDAYTDAVQAITKSWMSSGSYKSDAKAALVDADGSSRAAVRAVARWVRARGLAAPALIVNGRVSPSGGAGPGGFQQELMTLVSAEMQLLQTAVYKQQVDDSVHPSVLHALLGRATRLTTAHVREAKKRAASGAAPITSYALPGAGTILPRWHPSVLSPDEDQAFLPLSAPHARPMLDAIAYIAAPGTVDEVKGVSLTLVDDLNTAEGLFSLASLLAYTRGSSGSSSSSAPGASPTPVPAHHNSSSVPPALPCAPASGLSTYSSLCPVAVPHLAEELGKAIRVGALHVPQLLLMGGQGAGAGAGVVEETRGTAAAGAVKVQDVGGAVSLLLSLISGSHPSLAQVRADDRAPLAGAVVDLARGAVLGTLQPSSAAGGKPLDAFVAALRAYLLDAAAHPVKPRVAAGLLRVLDASLTLAGDEEGAEGAVQAARELLASQARAVDVARRVLPEALPQARIVTSLSSSPTGTGGGGHGGLGMRVRALAANGRVLALMEAAAPSARSSGTGAAPGGLCESGEYPLPTPDIHGKASLAPCVGVEDVAVLALHEQQQRGAAVAALLQTCDFSSSGLDADSLTAEWMSGVAQSAASAVGASLTVPSGSAGGKAAGRVALRTELLASHVTSFTSIASASAGAGSGNGSATGLYVTAIIDPASEDSQRYAPLLLMMRDRLGASVTVHLNPGTGYAELPVKSFFRYVLPAEIPVLGPSSGDSSRSKTDAGAGGRGTAAGSDSAALTHPRAAFAWLPPSTILTLKTYVPEPWNTQLAASTAAGGRFPAAAVVDMDNLRLNQDANPNPNPGASPATTSTGTFLHAGSAHVTATYELKDLLAAGQCVDGTGGSIGFPNGLQLSLGHKEGGAGAGAASGIVSDTLVMQNLGYWQLKAQPGVWSLALAEGRASQLYDILLPPSAALAGAAGGGKRARGRAAAASSASGSGMAAGYAFLRKLALGGGSEASSSSEGGAVTVSRLDVTVRDFTGPSTLLMVRKKAGKERESLLAQIGSKEASSGEEDGPSAGGGGGGGGGLMGRLFSSLGGAKPSSSSSAPSTAVATVKPLVHVFSLASGLLYERFLKIMILAAIKASPSVRLKFWLVENFLSPGFKAFAPTLAAIYGAEVAFVTYKWPNWLRAQSEKQRIIWGYKILFLDVLFPLNVSKIIYIDADQVVRADLAELWNHDLQGAPYAYTPFCDSRQETLGYQFWREGYWKDHLRGKPYHISALYVVDLAAFRRSAVGDNLRAVYDQLSRDPNSLSNLDQDLPNYAQHAIPIHSLPQSWLWCESWCSDDSKAASKTIDLCNNPRFKEPKLDMARRVIAGPLFPGGSWDQLDSEIAGVEEEWRQARRRSGQGVGAAATAVAAAETAVLVDTAGSVQRAS